ncbi:MAG: pyridoxal-dependent decarboxylase [Phycisphaerae bacterium]|jgi:aromatic-L-amino-acid decarboxylase
MTRDKQASAPPVTPSTDSSANAHLGDIPPTDFRAAMHRAADMVADYLEHVGEYPVLPRIQPGDVRRQLPAGPPEQPEPLGEILDDYKRLIEPNTTHWNHPGFMAYFAVTGSGPGILGEMLSAGLNVNAMLWRTGPAATELEAVACDWLRQLMGLPATYKGHINDTASMSSFLALAVARQRVGDYDIRHRGMAGRTDLPPLTLYASDQAHSSIDKAAVALGLGLDNLRRIPTDDAFRMDLAALEAAIRADRAAGRQPMAVVATVGTTSTTSVDPVPAIADICQREGMWLHVDAAYAGVGAMCPELRAKMPGLDRADSIVTNPHKWMFVPVDCSLLLLRDAELLKETFSIVPYYLTTKETEVTNLMDLGVQLGRRFRALKLWMVMRTFGAEGLRARIRQHCAIARELESWIAAEPGFELIAPVPFSTVCFRATPDLPPAKQDAFNERLLSAVNAAGPVLVSHTQLRGRFVMRMTVGNLRTRREHVAAAWALIREMKAEIEQK